MPFAESPMKPGSVPLDAPPPLPKEAKRKAPPDWMSMPEDSTSLGASASNPLIQIMTANKKMEEAIQLAQVAAPQMADQWAQLLQVFSQAASMALQSLAQPAPSPVGASQGLMASPMPPMAPMGAGGAMGPSGM